MFRTTLNTLFRRLPHAQRHGAGAVLALVLSVTALPAPAVDFALPDIHGKSHRLSDYRGQWVVVNFWATWCPPCLDEIPDLIAFHEKHKNSKAIVLGINYEPELSDQQLRDFSDDFKITYPVLRGDAGLEKILGPIFGMPTTYLVTPEGEAVASVEGQVPPESIEEFIENYSPDRRPSAQ